jgi:tRNA 2-thiouridine synthesizing protein A
LPETLDCRGLRCPLPVLRTEKRLAGLPAGARLTVLATDPMARIDIPLYCTRHGFACATHAEGDLLRFEITRP